MEYRFVALPGGQPKEGLPAQLPAIQALRAVAALAIVLLHAFQEADTLGRALGGVFPMQRVLPLEAGVDLFFVISGFVMVYASRDAFGRTASIAPFLRRRLARIVPIYWAVTLVYIAISLGGLAPVNRPRPDVWEIGASFLFIPWLVGAGPLVQPVYSLGWTLNYEMAFYLLFACVLPLRRETAVPVLVAILMALVLAGQFVPSTQVQLHFWTRSIILEFAMGALIGQMALAGVRPSRGLAAGLAAAALALLWIGHARMGLFPDRALQYGLPAALVTIAALAFGGHGAQGLAARLLVRLGDASYAIYILHPFVLRGLAVTAGIALTRLSPWLYIAVCLVLVCCVSFAAWRWFERPVTKALQGSRQG
jgi:exopolysaccharide production protein ExoZ